MKIVYIIIYISLSSLLSSCISFDVFETARTLNKNQVMMRVNTKRNIEPLWDDTLSTILGPQLALGYGLTKKTDFKLQFNLPFQGQIAFKYMVAGDKLTPFSISIQPFLSIGTNSEFSAPKPKVSMLPCYGCYSIIPSIKPKDSIYKLSSGISLFVSYFNRSSSWTISPKYIIEYNFRNPRANTKTYYLGLGIGWKYHWEYTSIGASISSFKKYSKININYVHPDLYKQWPIDLGLTFQVTI